MQVALGHALIARQNMPEENYVKISLVIIIIQ
jgi:hypothetical protein